MNFDLNDDQQSVIDSLDQLLASETGGSLHVAASHVYGDRLDSALADSGFLDIAYEDGFGTLDAALVVERIARSPQIVEASASALVAPLLPLDRGVRPLAMTSCENGAIRFLPVAAQLLIDRGSEGLLVPVERARVVPVDTLLAYPYGRLDEIDLSAGVRIDDMECVRRPWRIALAVEAAGCMAAALAVVIENVTDRHAFGRPLGAFQAIQHRLAMAAETAESTRWLALRAAWSDAADDAALAAGFAQMRIAAFTYDLHQFSGAMGLTLEYPLHLWTYRLRAIAGDLGGASLQARELAKLTWGLAA